MGSKRNIKPKLAPSVRDTTSVFEKEARRIIGDKVDKSRRIDTTAPLVGGGDLSADRTLAVGQFTPASAGVVPASGGGTTNFLRADGTWAAAGSGGGVVTSVTAGSSKVTASPTTGDVVVDVVPANFTGIPESGVTNLVSDLASKVPTTRTISTTAPLTGGGDLSANRTLAVSTFGSGASGVVPASGGGTVNFLRADGSWSVPAGTGITGSGTTNKVAKFTSATAIGDSNVVENGSTVSMTLPIKVSTGSSGVGTLVSTSIAEIEAADEVAMTIAGPTNAYKAIFFANPSSVADGGILYDDTPNGFARGFEFRAGGNTNRLTISSGGTVSVMGNTALNTSSGVTTVTGHGDTTGDLQVADATTGLASANYVVGSFGFTGTMHLGSGAGSAPMTGGFHAVRGVSSVINAGASIAGGGETNANSWIAGYFDSQSVDGNTWALYTEHGDCKFNATAGASTFGGNVTISGNVSVPTGNTASATFSVGAGGPVWTGGGGSPESVVTAGPGSIYSDVTNGELYIKHTGTGNTGWKLVTHA